MEYLYKCVEMDMLLNFTFKSALHFSTLAMKPFNSSTYKVVLSYNCYCNAMKQSSLKRFNCHPNNTPYIKSNVLSIMYSMYNAFFAI